MELVSTFTVCRHAVKTVLNGLSDFQHDLLTNEALIRFAEAPAGCGKSYAFLRAVLDGKRVLFVVPTRRLAMNLIASLQEDMKSEGWSDTKIQKKIALWSSDGRSAMQAMGVKNVTQKRLHELSELSPLDGGEIIVTTPESLAWLVLDPARYPQQGVSDVSVLDIIASFDHLVFDEMHTIEKRGLSLSFILGWLCVQFPQWQTRLSYLSATPIDLSAPLKRFGFESSDIANLSEKITDLACDDAIEGMRVIHGDVGIACYKYLSLSELLKLNADKVLKEIDAGRQVIVIFDQLFDGLSKSLPELALVLAEMDLNTKDALLISSVDDSQKGNADYLGFSMGSHHDPKNFPILIATSSIEIGVTFQCRLLFMEPGHNAASLVQRIGRVSRGDYTGEIHISMTTQNLGRHVWLRQFLAWSEKNQNQRVSIRDLTQTLCQSLSICVSKPKVGLGRSTSCYGSMPAQAAVIAGLYWQYMMMHVGLQKARHQLLWDKQPKIAFTVTQWLKPIRALLDDPMYEDAATQWLAIFEAEVKVLRTMPKSVTVRSLGSNNQWTISVFALRRDTDLLDFYDITENQQGQFELWIDEVHWRNRLVDEKRTVKVIQHLCLPHSQMDFPFEHQAKPALLKMLKRELNSNHSQLVIEALKSVKEVTEQTGLICVKDL
ncbi:DEAD/DEAH box helicase [Photobacterium leiognathi]|uniref:DEAD/DEAH box helicase n=1 Tax=Photobacterium leiognathi TaxID=553611 RepID=UPI0029811CF9|nr:DEAD/DEAH box helicase [Photobacterium leiognathi]